MVSKPVWLACCLALSGPVMADELCADYDLFQDQGWQYPQVQDAMDTYLREHRMRANWLNQPAPPDQIGRDYYEWLWHNSFGARMKSEVVHRFCGAGSGAEEERQ